MTFASGPESGSSSLPPGADLASWLVPALWMVRVTGEGPAAAAAVVPIPELPTW